MLSLWGALISWQSIWRQSCLSSIAPLLCPIHREFLLDELKALPVPLFSTWMRSMSLSPWTLLFSREFTVEFPKRGRLVPGVRSVFLLNWSVETFSFKFLKLLSKASTSIFHLARSHDFFRSFNLLSSMNHFISSSGIIFEAISFLVNLPIQFSEPNSVRVGGPNVTAAQILQRSRSWTFCRSLILPASSAKKQEQSFKKIIFSNSSQLLVDSCSLTPDYLGWAILRSQSLFWLKICSASWCPELVRPITATVLNKLFQPKSPKRVVVSRL